MIKRDDVGLNASSQRKAFRDNLEARMKELGIKAAELARRTELSKDAISSYTTMRSLPTKETLAKLAKVLRCSPKKLLPPEDHDDLGSVIEIREYGRPGFKLLVARVLVPDNATTIKWYETLRNQHAASLKEIADKKD
jgi:transcriptional regulator with XRE-family HTH domain